MRKLLLGLSLPLLALLLSLQAPPAHALDIAVTTFVDELTTNNQCSLREAISNINDNAQTYTDCPGGATYDTITLPANQYSLSLAGASEDNNATGDLDIKADLIINGDGQQNTTINGASLDRVFHIVDDTITVEINGLRIVNGRAPDGAPGQNGGGIYASGNLTLDDIEFQYNQAGHGVGSGGLGGHGGALYMDANGVSLTVTGSEFYDNFAGDGGSDGPTGYDGGHGGALYIATQATLSDLFFLRNASGSGGSSSGSGGNGGHGGAVYFESAAGLLIDQDTQIFFNAAGSGGSGAGNGRGGDGGHGGGIAVGGAASNVTLRATTVNENSSGDGGDGGGAGNGGNGGHGGGLFLAGQNISVDNSFIFENLTGSGGDGGCVGGTAGFGGGLFVAQGATVVVEARSFVEANATGTRGAVSPAAAVAPQSTDCVLAAGEGRDSLAPQALALPAGNGGGVANEGQLTIEESTIIANTAEYGGGLFSRGGTADTQILRSTISGNEANNSGGGLMVAHTSSARLDQSTVSGNTANNDGGGLFAGDPFFDGGTVVAVNSTFSGNSADRGGGVFVHAGGGDFTAINSTLAGNSVTSNGNSIYADFEVSNSNSIRLNNTILFTDAAASECLIEAGSSITTLGNNLDSDGTCLPAPAAGDQPGVDPLLGPLQNNGGPTQTHALLPGSPAVGAAFVDTCLSISSTDSVDQRGIDRFAVDSACDIGAYEQTTSLAIIKDATPPDGTDFPFTLTAANIGPVAAADLLHAGPANRLQGADGVEVQFTLDDAVPDDGDAYGDQALITFNVFEEQPQSGIGNDFPLELTIQEVKVDGFVLNEISCSGGSLSEIVTDRDNLTAAISLEKNEHITCTFTNTDDAKLTIEKITEPAGGQGFPFTLQGFNFLNRNPTPPIVATLDDGESETLFLSSEIEYLLGELVPQGWRVKSIVCSMETQADGDDAVFFGLEAGSEHTCTFTNERDVFIKLIPSFLVTRVEEGLLSGEGSKACYWLTLPAPPGGDVVVDIDPDNLLQEVTVDKSAVTLNDSNWDNLGLANRSNFVCVRAVDDAVDELEDERCGDKSAAMTSDVLPYGQECGDHIELVEHRVSQASTAPGYDQNTPFANHSLTELGQPPDDSLEVLIRDNDVAGVFLTESFAVSDLDESGSPVSKACYWVNLTSQPTSEVRVEVDQLDEVVPSKIRVFLTPENWHDRDPGEVFNRICLTPEQESDVDPRDARCFTGSAELFGAAGSGEEVCGTHLGSIIHFAFSSDTKYNNTTNFSGNGPDFDNDRRTIDILIRDDDTANVLFNPATVNVLEGSETSFDVSLSSRPTADVTVEGGESWLNFTAANWNVPQPVTVQVPQDNTAEAPQTLLQQFTVSSADGNFNGIKSDPVQVTVVDDDSAGVLLSSTVIAVDENGGRATYDVRLTSRPAAAVSVTLNGDEQLAVQPQSLRFDAGNWDQAQRVTVTAVNDQVAEEALHSGRITHSVSSGDALFDGLQVAAIQAAVSDNDAAGLSVGAETLAVAEGGATAVYAVALTSQPTAAVTVAIDGGGQAAADPALLTFTPYNWETPQEVTVSAVDDAVDEAESHLAALSHRAASGDPFYDGLEADEIAVTIGDNDQAGVLLSRTQIQAAAGSRPVYTLRLASRPAAEVVIDLVGSSGVLASGSHCDDGEGAASCAIFTPDNWDVAQTVTVLVLGPGEIAHQVSSADPVYNGLAVRPLTVDAFHAVYMPISRGQ